MTASTPSKAPCQIVEQRGPFTVIRRDIKHDRFGMQLIADMVVERAADGTAIEGEQFWFNFPTESVLIFAIKENTLYLTKEFTYGTGDYSIEVPGGKIDMGETPAQAAQRELQEELGLQALYWTYLGFTRQLTSRANNTAHLFLASGVRVIGNAQLDPNEVIQGFPVALEQAYAMVEGGMITTAAVEVGIWRLRRWLAMHQDD